MSNYPPKVEGAAEMLVYYLQMSHPDGFFNADAKTEMRSIIYDLYDALKEETKADALHD